MTKQKINLHTHSTFSDGKNTAEEHILAAIEKGFTVLGFSEHSFYPLDPAFYSPFDSNWHMLPQTFPEYVTTMKALKEKYADRIKLLLGFEAEYFYSEKIGLAFPDKNEYKEFAPADTISAARKALRHFMFGLNFMFSLLLIFQAKIALFSPDKTFSSNYILK